MSPKDKNNGFITKDGERKCNLTINTISEGAYIDKHLAKAFKVI